MLGRIILAIRIGRYYCPFFPGDPLWKACLKGGLMGGSFAAGLGWSLEKILLKCS